MGRLTPLGLALSLVALCGCKAAAPLLVAHDSEARAFEVRCDQEKEGSCAVTQRSGAKWPGDATSLVLHTAGRVLGVCNVPAGKAVDATIDCRPLVCQKDTDCPCTHGLTKGTCLGGLCTDQSHAIEESDAVMLCLAGTGLGHDSLAQVERYAMAQQCGRPCQVPSACRQP